MATILFLAHRIPYPPNKGDKLRAYQVLNHWTKHHKVFLGCFIDDPEDLEHRDLPQERCAGTYFARLHPKVALTRAFGAFLSYYGCENCPGVACRNSDAGGDA